MSASVGSASRITDGGGSLTGGSSKTSSNESASTHRVMVEEFFPHELQVPICLLPQNNLSTLQGQRCTVKVYGVDIENEAFGELSPIRAELSALLAEIDENGNYIVELRCDLAAKNPRQHVCFRFQFEDQVRKVQLLPLPLKTGFKFDPQFESTTDTVQTLGALLVVLSKFGGMSVHSIVLSRTSDDEPFRIAEFKKVSRGSIEDTFDFLEVSLFVDAMAQDSQGLSDEALDSVLYAGILPKSTSARSQRVDVLASPLVRHKSPLFRFTTAGPTRALKRTVVLTGCGTTKGVSVSARRIGNLSYCTVATLSNSEVKVIRLPALDRWSTETLKLEDILVVPLDEYSLGDPSHVFHLRGGPETSHHISYLVVCQDREPDESAQLADTTILAPMTFGPSPLGEFLEKDTIPPDWTATETRIAVLRTRRQVLTEIEDILHDKDTVPQKSQECCDIPSLHPTKTRDERLDSSLDSPETAVLDRSSKWMRTSISDSISTPLAGLNFSGEDDVAPEPSRGYSTESANLNQSCDPRQPSSNALIPRSTKLVLVSVPAKEETSSKDPVRTEIFPISDHFPTSFDILRLHEMENQIVMAAVATGSAKGSILAVPFHRGSFQHSPSMMAAMPPTQVDLPDRVTVKALDFEINRTGSLLLRATLAKAKNIFDGQEGLPSVLLCEHLVSFKSFSIPLTKRNGDDLKTSRPPKKRKGGVGISKISAKLDMILNALQKFESNVNEKLRILEKREIDNAERLSRLEMSFNFRYTRAEI